MLGLDRPDDFRGDPYGYLTNQMSHVLAGIAGAWTCGLIAAPDWLQIAAAVLVSGGVEALQLRNAGLSWRTVRDSLEDFGFVVAGALWQALDGPPVVALWIVANLVLGVRGARRRP